MEAISTCDPLTIKAFRSCKALWLLSCYSGTHLLIRYSITTFSEVSRQGLSQQDLQELRDVHKGDLKSFRKTSGNKLGDLFQIDWYRVILDEAHAKVSPLNIDASCAYWLTRFSDYSLSAPQRQLSMAIDWYTPTQRTRRYISNLKFEVIG